MYIAKMVTRYPDYHGEGYYNFIMDEDYDTLLDKVEDNSHDFMLGATIVKTRHKSIEALVAQYPEKSKLNNKYFGEK
jgi:nitrogen regulatory protein PII-like uncharacterized protein